MNAPTLTRPDWLAFGAPVDVLITRPRPSWRPAQVIEAHPVDGHPRVWRVRVAFRSASGTHVARVYTGHETVHHDSLIAPAPPDRPPLFTPEQLATI